MSPKGKHLGTHHQGSETERVALDAFIKLRRAAESVSNRVNGHLATAGLTESQFGVLEALWHLGPLSQAILARKILRSSGNLTLVVDNLEKRKLVVRAREIRDRRFVTVSLTGEGERLIRSLFPAHLQRIVAELEQLTPEERIELARLCRKLGLGNRETTG
jgi:MarR family transcriptional regulator, 2-MHQ and catechol-resistance regulon repressor